MDPLALLEGQEALEEQDEHGEEREHGEQEDPVVALAKEFGYRPDGKLPANEFLKKKLSTTAVSPNVAREMRETRREIANLKEIIFAQAQERSEHEIKSLDKQFREAIENGDIEESTRLATLIAEKKVRSSKPEGRKQEQKRQAGQLDDDAGEIQEIIEDFTENNPWVSADEEVSEFVTERMRVLTGQGYSAKGALSQIRREAKREFPDLFESQVSEQEAHEKRRPYSPPVGSGRPRSTKGEITLSDLPRSLREDAQFYIDRRMSEGVKHADATKEYIDTYKSTL